MFSAAPASARSKIDVATKIGPQRPHRRGLLFTLVLRARSACELGDRVLMGSRGNAVGGHGRRGRSGHEIRLRRDRTRRTCRRTTRRAWAGSSGSRASVPAWSPPGRRYRRGHRGLPAGAQGRAHNEVCSARRPVLPGRRACDRGGAGVSTVGRRTRARDRRRLSLAAAGRHPRHRCEKRRRPFLIWYAGDDCRRDDNIRRIEPPSTVQVVACPVASPTQVAEAAYVPTQFRAHPTLTFDIHSFFHQTSGTASWNQPILADPRVCPMAMAQSLIRSDQTRRCFASASRKETANMIQAQMMISSGNTLLCRFRRRRPRSGA